MGALITPGGLDVRKIWVCLRLESTGRGAEGMGRCPHLVRGSQSIQLEESERRQVAGQSTDDNAYSYAFETPAPSVPPRRITAPACKENSTIGPAALA